LQLLQFLYISVIYIYGLSGRLLVLSRLEAADLHSVTAVRLRQFALDM